MVSSGRPSEASLPADTGTILKKRDRNLRVDMSMTYHKQSVRKPTIGFVARVAS